MAEQGSLTKDLPLFCSEELQLSLADPCAIPSVTQPTTSNTNKTKWAQLAAIRLLWHNILPIKELVLSFVICLAFTVLYCFFIYSVLIYGNPQVGVILFDASTANLLTSIFSQVFVMLSDMMIRGLLDTLRVVLIKREKGTPTSTFFGLSAASEWQSAFRLAWVNKFLNLWCDFRSVTL